MMRKAPGGTGKRRCGSHPGFLILSIGLLLTAVVLRVFGAWWYACSPNPDYAVVVQMARHMARGEAFPTFFYGQAYMGSLEPAVSAVLIRLFGSAPFVVCLGTAAVSMLAVLGVFWTALRSSGRAAAIAATALCLIGPVGHFHYMCSPRGGYALCLLLTVLLIHAATFLDERPDVAPRRVIAGFWGLGLLCGLGFWNFWLVMPAIGTVGMMLLFRLRLRVLHVRVWLPGLAGFVFGSLPWWLWNAQNDWASLERSASIVDVRTCTEAVRMMFAERIPSLIGFFVVQSRWIQLLAYAGVVYLVVLPFVAALIAHRTPETLPFRRLTAAVLVFLTLFTLAFSTSAFAAIRSPRYMLPLVPVFAIWAGSGIGALQQRLIVAQGRLFRWAGGLAVGVAWGGLAFLFVLSLRTLPVHQSHPRDWTKQVQVLAKHPGVREAAYADFVHFGINWVTDERVCAVSPRLWRYRPYARRLERATSPGVIENMGAFSHFLRNTGTTAPMDRPGGYRLHYQAVPPADDFRILPADAVESILDENGVDWRQELLDSNGQTAAYLREADAAREVGLTVTFKEPVRLVGVRAVTRPRGPISGWSVDGQRGDGQAWTGLSGFFRNPDFFWSGMRFYAGGIHFRSEKCFPETEVTALRIRMPIHWSSDAVPIETLRLLCRGSPRAEKKPAAVQRWVEKNSPVNRIFADRWPANQLVEHVASGVWIQREPMLTGEDPDWVTSVPLDGTAAIVVNGGEAEQSQTVLRKAGVSFRVDEAGGYAVLVPHVEGGQGTSQPDVRFYAGQLFNNVLPASNRPAIPAEAAYFDGKLVLRGLSDWHLRESGDRTLLMTLDWWMAPGFECPKRTFIFLHGINESRRIGFQLDEPFGLDPTPYGKGRARVTSTVHRIPIPADVVPGSYRLFLGLLKPGLFPRRIPPTTQLPIDEDRIQLPQILHVD